jgi:hypothetical protein
METARPTPDSGKWPMAPIHGAFSDALRYWELRRVVYNFVLASVVVLWIVLTWPHFRPALTFSSLAPLTVLALLANLCYCAAYIVDIPMQLSFFAPAWRARRWGLWLLGMLLAVVIANYWIVDEIYPDFH